MNDGLASNFVQVVSDGALIPTSPTFVSTPPTLLVVEPRELPAQDRAFRVAGDAGTTSAVVFKLSARDSGKSAVGLYRVDDAMGRVRARCVRVIRGYVNAALAADPP